MCERHISNEGDHRLKLFRSEGFNVGGGFTYAIGSFGAHLYTEVRYHRALTAKIDTTVLPSHSGYDGKGKKRCWGNVSSPFIPGNCHY